MRENHENSGSRRAAVLAALTVYFITAVSGLAKDSVELQRVPDGGIQPQAALDDRGVIHLIYANGDPAAADLFYTHRSPGEKQFSPALRINSEPGSAIAIGTIRGAQLAVAAGRVHVAWNGRAPAGGTYMDAPMLYTRLKPDGAGFEHERNVINFARGLDGGGSLAADEKGNVYVFWHAARPGNTNGEAGRALFVARSRDGGKTFDRETLATSEPTGACACCGMKAFADHSGNIFALFRSAADPTERDELLLSGKAGEPLHLVLRQPWKIPGCPMSSASFSQTSSKSGSKLFAAWEREDNVFFANIRGSEVSPPISPAGSVKRKHPALAANAKGEVLLVWTEGTGWARGGSIAWQRFSADGATLGEPVRADGLPTWSLATAVAKPDGTFLVVY